MRNANTYTPTCTCVCVCAQQQQHIWNCSWRPHVCNNILLLAFSGLRLCGTATATASVCVCVGVLGVQAEFVIFFCNIFFCVPFDVLAGGRGYCAASVVGCAFG